MNNPQYELAAKNAEASVAMEGYEITPKMRRQCELVLSGKSSTSKCLKRLVEARKGKVAQQ